MVSLLFHHVVMARRTFRGPALVEHLEDLPVTVMAIGVWGDLGTTVEWRGRAIHGQMASRVVLLATLIGTRYSLSDRG
jgi:hypothetical protein